MADPKQTISNELSLDLSLLHDQDNDGLCEIRAELRESTCSSSDQDDMEEVLITETVPTTALESTKLDLSALSGGSSSNSSGPSLSRDRQPSSLPAVNPRPLMASEAWGSSESDTSDKRSGRMGALRQSKDALNSGKLDGEEGRLARCRLTDASTDKLPSMPMSSICTKPFPSRPKLPERRLAFGSTFVRDSNFHSTRLYGKPIGRPKVIPSFLRAHTRERRLQSLTVQKDKKESTTDAAENAPQVEKPKDFATLHLLARRSQGHLRYKYMAMLNEWIAEHGVPTT